VGPTTCGAVPRALLTVGGIPSVRDLRDRASVGACAAQAPHPQPGPRRAPALHCAEPSLLAEKLAKPPLDTPLKDLPKGLVRFRDRGGPHQAQERAERQAPGQAGRGMEQFMRGLKPEIQAGIGTLPLLDHMHFRCSERPSCNASLAASPQRHRSQSGAITPVQLLQFSPSPALMCLLVHGSECLCSLNACSALGHKGIGP